MTQTVKNLPAMQQTQLWSLGWEDPLEKGMATYSSILTWEIPWTEEPGRLKSLGWPRFNYDWVIRHSGKKKKALLWWYMGICLVFLIRNLTKERPRSFSLTFISPHFIIAIMLKSPLFKTLQWNSGSGQDQAIDSFPFIPLNANIKSWKKSSNHLRTQESRW